MPLGSNAIGRLALGEVGAATSKNIVAAAGSYTVTGVAAGLVNTRTVSAAVGTFSVTGQSAALPIKMPAAVGAFTVTGPATGLNFVRYLTATPYPIRSRNQFGFSALGEVALGQAQEPAGVTFLITGQPSGLAVKMPAAVGTFSVTGQDARIVKGQVMEAIGGVYTVTGQTVTLRLSMPAAVGTFTTTGNVIDFVRRRTKLRSFRRSGGAAVMSRPTGGRGMRAKAWGG